MQPATHDILLFRQFISDFYKHHGRAFPWRETTDPYAIWVSEIMLQQTQTERVIPKYNRFLQTFPTVQHLAKTSTQLLLDHWLGLGYNRRALNLKRTAEAIATQYHGQFPSNLETLLSLPGIGPYTARAIRVFAFNQPEALIETNVRTVFIYHFFSGIYHDTINFRLSGLSGIRIGNGIPNEKTPIEENYYTKDEQIPDSQILPLLQQSLDPASPRSWFYGIMDYGVIIKKLIGNHSTRSRHYTRQSKFQGSHRQKRALILRTVTNGVGDLQQIITITHLPPEIVTQIINELSSEGFLVMSNSTIRLK